MSARLLTLARLCAASGLAQAGAIEDLFQGWIDGVKNDKKWLATLRQCGFQVEVLDLARRQSAREAFEPGGAKGMPCVLARRSIERRGTGA